MPGKRLTDQQVKLYMDSRKKNFNQAISAAKAGVSERSGRRIESKQASVQKNQSERHWRTRKDPLEGVWDNELKPMLEAEPQLTADGLWEYLNDNYPGQYGRKIRRTLQSYRMHTSFCMNFLIFYKDIIRPSVYLLGRLLVYNWTS